MSSEELTGGEGSLKTHDCNVALARMSTTYCGLLVSGGTRHSRYQYCGTTKQIGKAKPSCFLYHCEAWNWNGLIAGWSLTLFV
jgi:hypothetical protein